MEMCNCFFKQSPSFPLIISRKGVGSESLLGLAATSQLPFFCEVLKHEMVQVMGLKIWGEGWHPQRADSNPGNNYQEKRHEAGTSLGNILGKCPWHQEPRAKNWQSRP